MRSAATPTSSTRSPQSEPCGIQATSLASECRQSTYRIQVDKSGLKPIWQRQSPQNHSKYEKLKKIPSIAQTEVPAQKSKRADQQQHKCTNKRFPHPPQLPMLVDAPATSVVRIRTNVTHVKIPLVGFTCKRFKCKTAPWPDQASTGITLHTPTPRLPTTPTPAAARISVPRHMPRKLSDATH